MKPIQYCSNCFHATHPSKYTNICRLGSDDFTECRLNNGSKWIDENDFIKYRSYSSKKEFITQKEMEI